MTSRFEDTDATTMPHCVFTPRETYGDVTLGNDEWGVCLGNPWATALVIVGRRDDVLDALTRARDELIEYYTAEHENGYHNAEPEARCPECQEEDPA